MQPKELRGHDRIGRLYNAVIDGALERSRLDCSTAAEREVDVHIGVDTVRPIPNKLISATRYTVFNIKKIGFSMIKPEASVFSLNQKLVSQNFN